ncbi:MAG: TonB-dependent receptor [Woeseiaceae bacterium]|jgi:outer membrane receptor protein involved in Fe transport|nr:TonB-dependent receptor [Woeseiaceae bacterium]
MRTKKSTTSVNVRVVLLVLAGAGISGPVHAQSNGPALEEIVVTAQKRTQSLIDVPLSITVISGQQLEQLQADNFQDMIALIPGFSINTQRRGVSRITLRGVNTGGVATTVGVYVNDVPFGSSSGLANGAILSGDFDTFDLQQLEVLRGPQGTLYGASALGGVMRYVTNAPSTEAFEARIKASVESVDNGDVGYALNGLINIPVSDTFALRGTGFYRNEPGFIDSIGNNPLPSLTDPTVNVVDGTRVEDGINEVDSYGARVSALFTPSERFSVDLTAHLQNIDSGSSDLVDADPTTLEPLTSDPVRSRYHDDFADISYRVYSATLDWDFGGVSLQSVTSYSEFEQEFRTDLAANTAIAGAPLAPLITLLFGDAATRPLSVVTDQVTATDKLTQEFRLVSADSDRFEWLVGLYYTDEDSGIDPQLIRAVEAGTETIASDIPDLARASLVSNFEEIALFANATWYLTPQFELSFGARQAENDQTASQRLEGVLVGGSVDFDDASSSESPFTYSFSPRYSFNDNMSVFARVATGYRPGGPNVIPTGAPPGTPGSYDSDELTSYEVGFKSTSPNGKFAFDVTAYFLDWEDVQLLAVVNGVGINANGGTAESKGFEFATSFMPVDGLTISANGAYTDAYLTEDTSPVVGGVDGDPLSFVPEWSFGLDADYSWNVMGGQLAYLGGNLAYVDDRPANFGDRDADGNIIRIDGYTTLNLRAGIDFETWSIELYGRNVTNEEGLNDFENVGILPNGAVGLSLIRPATYGVSLGLRF